MAEILPRQSGTESELAELTVVARFYNAECPDTGGIDLRPSRYNTDPIYEVVTRGGRGSFAFPRAGRRRSDLKDHYASVDFDGTLAEVTREDLMRNLPEAERGRKVNVQVVSLGDNRLKMYLFRGS